MPDGGEAVAARLARECVWRGLHPWKRRYFCRKEDERSATRYGYEVGKLRRHNRASLIVTRYGEATLESVGVFAMARFRPCHRDLLEGLNHSLSDVGMFDRGE